jgi:hypothetical protein
MTMSEYEERFRPRGPSLHQTFAATRGRNAGRRRRRIWIIAAAIGVLTITFGVASHHAVYGWTSSYSRTTAVQGQRSWTAFSDEFIVFLCGKLASGASRLPVTQAPSRFMQRHPDQFLMSAGRTSPLRSKGGNDPNRRVLSRTPAIVSFLNP